MKKLFIIPLNLIAVVTVAQDSLQNRSFISIAFGPAFPLGNFASKNINELTAGLAKNGFAIEVRYTHQFDDLFGFSSAFAYNRFPIKRYPFNESSRAAAKPWEYYQLLIGPSINGSIAPKIFLDASILSGTAFINASKVNLNGELVRKKYSTSAVPLQAAIDFRFLLNRTIYLFAGINYNYMCANFNVTVESQDLSFKQRINSTSIAAGVGWNFY